MRILISGASGFVGAPLKTHLISHGHDVVSLSRSSEEDSIFWDPENRLIPIQFIEGFDAVIHLAGDPLTFGRWSKKKKKRIYESRVDSTSFLCEVLSTLDTPPKVFICASAVGFYGDQKEEIVNEASPPGEGFLPSVCSAWEQACAPLKKRGCRVVNTRFGIVLGKGGALAKLEMLTRCGLGTILGNGKQWMSWIFQEDLILAIEHILNSSIDGPINCVSPNPIRQGEFAKLLAKVLHRPCMFKIPAFLLRILLGDIAKGMLLASTRASPEKLQNSGFAFKVLILEDVLNLLYIGE